MSEPTREVDNYGSLVGFPPFPRVSAGDVLQSQFGPGLVGTVFVGPKLPKTSSLAGLVVVRGVARMVAPELGSQATIVGAMGFHLVTASSLNEAAAEGRFQRVGKFSPLAPSEFTFPQLIGRNYAFDGTGEQVSPGSGIAIEAGFISYNIYDSCFTCYLDCSPRGYLARLIGGGMSAEVINSKFPFVDLAVLREKMLKINQVKASDG